MLADLQKARMAFCGDSERGQLIELIGAHHQPGSPALLDIGTGDGSFIRALFSRLSHSTNGYAVAIDPEYSPADESPEPRIRLVRTRLEDFEPAEDFTCINMRQSAYYLDSPSDSVGRAMKWLRQYGIFAITLWARECVLYKLNAAIQSETDSRNEPLSFDRICARISAEGSCELVCREVIKGGLDAKMVSEDASLAAAIFKIAARKRDISKFSFGEQASFVRTFLTHASPSVRVNEIRIYRKV